jgi:hypothetical protein
MTRWKPIAGAILAAGLAAGSVVWIREEQAARTRAEDEARRQHEKAAREAEEDRPDKSYRQLVGEMSM